MYKLLIIDDEATICNSLEFAFEDEYDTTTASDYFTVKEYIEKYYYDIILLDLKLGEVDGIKVLELIKNRQPDCQVIMMTAYSSVDTSIMAMKLGAWDYVIKPLCIENLRLMIKKALEYKDLSNRLALMENELKNVQHEDIIGDSKPIKEVFGLINKVKDIDVNVLVTGESGTGKELVARRIHYNGARKTGRFEAINCGAIPKNLIESELFGYKQGAFTGAVKDRKGKFQLADKGTLFLDEIGEMDIETQVKLLRVVQDKVVYPVGSEEGIPVDVRLIAATNKDLRTQIEKKLFREDLYYRLNVINIKTPSLSQRREDIPLLVEYFIKKYSGILNKSITSISSQALEVLKVYSYKGNIRELENIIERAVILTENKTIDTHDLPNEVISDKDISLPDDKLIISIYDTLSLVEEKVIKQALKKYNKRKAAKILGISERTLWNKIKKYDEC